MDPFQRVLAEPGSIAARKALAAHWHAKNDPRAELVDKQLALRDLHLKKDYASPRAQQVAADVKALILNHGRAFAGRVADLVDSYEFHRGLVAQVTVSGAKFPSLASELFKLAPIQHVNVTSPLGSIETLLAVPEIRKLVSIDFARMGTEFGNAGAIALARSPNVKGLRYIELMSCAIDSPGVEALAASPYLDHAVYIGFGGNPADPTPYSIDNEGAFNGGRPPLAAELERTYGKKPWLAVPNGEFPPPIEELAVTP